MTTSTRIILDGWLPLWLALALVLAVLAIGVFLIWRRASGGVWRFALLVLVLFALLDPRLVVENRRPLDDIVLVVDDGSQSQEIEGRQAQQAKALDGLRKRLAALPNVEVREATIGQDEGGTLGLPAIQNALAGIDSARLGAVVLLSDGQVADLGKRAEDLPFDAPLHVLLTGKPNERDRTLSVDGAPAYALVGEPFRLRVRANDLPVESADGVGLRLLLNGKPVERRTVRPGEETDFDVTLDRPGESVVVIEADPSPGEVSLRNNSRFIKVNGIRDRLRVLLVSGQPYPGLRVWRNVLKADPTIDLVHFTILRPPEKQDGTPINELALIAFPSRELFEEKLSGFDLVIFDRYARRGLLPLLYLDNVARYVEDGGALLEAAGPEFAQPASLYRTPLARVLPGRPTGEVFERRLVPQITDLGRRHPVTQALLGDGERPAWGPWFRQIDVDASDSMVLMNGAAERPLLLLKRVGKGRVAQLLSDHAWLWARGVEGGGPHVSLLRRVLHWLMREPELEEERLLGRAVGDDIEIERRSLEDGNGDVTVTLPDGRTQAVALGTAGDGVRRGRLPVAEPGFYKVSDGDLTTYVAGRPMPLPEIADLRSSPEALAPAVEKTGGSVRWITDGLPALREVGPRSVAGGNGWIGLRHNEVTALESRTEAPLLPPLLTLTLLAGTAALAWWREGRA